MRYAVLACVSCLPEKKFQIEMNRVTLHVLYMDISRLGQLYSMAAANMLTEIVFPNRRGVDTSTSCDRWSQPLTSSIFWWSLANTPCFSRFQKILAQALMKLS